MRPTFLIAAPLAALLSAIPPAQAAPVNANCAVNQAAVSVSTANAATKSQNFVNVAESAIPFVQGKTSCVVVSLSAEAMADANTSMAVRVVIDGTTVCESSYESFVRNDATRSVRAAHFLCTDVGPGAHKIRLQFRSSGGNVVLDTRTVTVHYFK